MHVPIKLSVQRNCLSVQRNVISSKKLRVIIYISLVRQHNKIQDQNSKSCALPINHLKWNGCLYNYLFNIYVSSSHKKSWIQKQSLNLIRSTKSTLHLFLLLMGIHLYEFIFIKSFLLNRDPPPKMSYTEYILVVIRTPTHVIPLL